jgi:hypothetical protein
MSKLLITLSAAVLLLGGTPGFPARAQTSVDPSPDLRTLAQQMPSCREFRNDCQVCVRLSDGTLGCSNMSIACSPAGKWRCSIPDQLEGGTK